MIVDVPSIPQLFGREPYVADLDHDYMSRGDYAILGAVLQAVQPRLVFEVGTHRGLTSQFMLDLLPEAKVVSIAMDSPAFNSYLPRAQIGLAVTSRDRYTQLIGDSHELDPAAFVRLYGRPDFVLIDGDHSARGVKLDTELAFAILAPGGVIAWHDADFDRYHHVREFLAGAEFTAHRQGNVAVWR